jgi:hypothetical protein
VVLAPRLALHHDVDDVAKGRLLEGDEPRFNVAQYLRVLVGHEADKVVGVRVELSKQVALVRYLVLGSVLEHVVRALPKEARSVG